MADPTQHRDGPLIWFHAASIAECAVTLPVVFRCLQEYNDNVSVLLTTACPDAHLLLQASLSSRVIVELSALDNPGAAAIFMQQWRPRVGVLMESAFEPHLLHAAAQHGVRLALLNARMPPDRLAAAHAQPASRDELSRALKHFALIVPQSDLDVGRFRLFGATLSQMPGWSRDLQQAAALGANVWHLCRPSADRIKALSEVLAHRQVWLATTASPEEDVLVAQAVLQLRADWPGLLTIVAPWNGRDCEAVAAAVVAEGLSTEFWSRVQPTVPSSCDILVVEDAAEVALMQAVSEIAYVGTTSNDGCGSSLLAEAAVAACAVLVAQPVGGQLAHTVDELNNAALLAAEEAVAVSSSNGTEATTHNSLHVSGDGSSSGLGASDGLERVTDPSLHEAACPLPLVKPSRPVSAPASVAHSHPVVAAARAQAIASPWPASDAVVLTGSQQVSVGGDQSHSLDLEVQKPSTAVAAAVSSPTILSTLRLARQQLWVDILRNGSGTEEGLSSPGRLHYDVRASHSQPATPDATQGSRRTTTTVAPWNDNACSLRHQPHISVGKWLRSGSSSTSSSPNTAPVAMAQAPTLESHPIFKAPQATLKGCPHSSDKGAVAAAASLANASTHLTSSSSPGGRSGTAEELLSDGVVVVLSLAAAAAGIAAASKGTSRSRRSTLDSVGSSCSPGWAVKNAAKAMATAYRFAVNAAALTSATSSDSGSPPTISPREEALGVTTPSQPAARPPLLLQPVTDPPKDSVAALHTSQVRFSDSDTPHTSTLQRLVTSPEGGTEMTCGSHRFEGSEASVLATFYSDISDTASLDECSSCSTLPPEEAGTVVAGHSNTPVRVDQELLGSSNNLVGSFAEMGCLDMMVGSLGSSIPLQPAGPSGSAANPAAAASLAVLPPLPPGRRHRLQSALLQQPRGSESETDDLELEVMSWQGKHLGGWQMTPHTLASVHTRRKPLGVSPLGGESPIRSNSCPALVGDSPVSFVSDSPCSTDDPTFCCQRLSMEEPLEAAAAEAAAAGGEGDKDAGLELTEQEAAAVVAQNSGVAAAAAAAEAAWNIGRAPGGAVLPMRGGLASPFSNQQPHAMRRAALFGNSPVARMNAQQMDSPSADSMAFGSLGDWTRQLSNQSLGSLEPVGSIDGWLESPTHLPSPTRRGAGDDSPSKAYTRRPPPSPLKASSLAAPSLPEKLPHTPAIMNPQVGLELPVPATQPAAPTPTMATSLAVAPNPVHASANSAVSPAVDSGQLECWGSEDLGPGTAISSSSVSECDIPANYMCARAAATTARSAVPARLSRNTATSEPRPRRPAMMLLPTAEAAFEASILSSSDSVQPLPQLDSTGSATLAHHAPVLPGLTSAAERAGSGSTPAPAHTLAPHALAGVSTTTSVLAWFDSFSEFSNRGDLSPGSCSIASGGRRDGMVRATSPSRAEGADDSDCPQTPRSTQGGHSQFSTPCSSFDESSFPYRSFSPAAGASPSEAPEAERSFVVQRQRPLPAAAAVAAALERHGSSLLARAGTSPASALQLPPDMHPLLPASREDIREATEHAKEVPIPETPRSNTPNVSPFATPRVLSPERELVGASPAGPLQAEVMQQSVNAAVNATCWASPEPLTASCSPYAAVNGGYDPFASELPPALAAVEGRSSVLAPIPETPRSTAPNTSPFATPRWSLDGYSNNVFEPNRPQVNGDTCSSPFAAGYGNGYDPFAEAVAAADAQDAAGHPSAAQGQPHIDIAAAVAAAVAARGRESQTSCAPVTGTYPLASSPAPNDSNAKRLPPVPETPRSSTPCASPFSTPRRMLSPADQLAASEPDGLRSPAVSFASHNPFSNPGPQHVFELESLFGFNSPAELHGPARTAGAGAGSSSFSEQRSPSAVAAGSRPLRRCSSDAPWQIAAASRAALNDGGVSPRYSTAVIAAITNPFAMTACSMPRQPRPAGDSSCGEGPSPCPAAVRARTNMQREPTFTELRLLGPSGEPSAAAIAGAATAPALNMPAAARPPRPPPAPATSPTPSAANRAAQVASGGGGAPGGATAHASAAPPLSPRVQDSTSVPLSPRAGGQWQQTGGFEDGLSARKPPSRCNSLPAHSVSPGHSPRWPGMHTSRSLTSPVSPGASLSPAYGPSRASAAVPPVPLPVPLLTLPPSFASQPPSPIVSPTPQQLTQLSSRGNRELAAIAAAAIFAGIPPTNTPSPAPPSPPAPRAVHPDPFLPCAVSVPRSYASQPVSPGALPSRPQPIFPASITHPARASRPAACAAGNPIAGVPQSLSPRPLRLPPSFASMPSSPAMAAGLPVQPLQRGLTEQQSGADAAAATAPTALAGTSLARPMEHPAHPASTLSPRPVLVPQNFATQPPSPGISPLQQQPIFPTAAATSSQQAAEAHSRPTSFFDRPTAAAMRPSLSAPVSPAAAADVRGASAVAPPQVIHHHHHHHHFYAGPLPGMGFDGQGGWPLHVPPPIAELEAAAAAGFQRGAALGKLPPPPPYMQATAAWTGTAAPRLPKAQAVPVQRQLPGAGMWQPAVVTSRQPSPRSTSQPGSSTSTGVPDILATMNLPSLRLSAGTTRSQPGSAIDAVAESSTSRSSVATFGGGGLLATAAAAPPPVATPAASLPPVAAPSRPPRSPLPPPSPSPRSPPAKLAPWATGTPYVPPVYSNDAWGEDEQGTQNRTNGGNLLRSFTFSPVRPKPFLSADANLGRTKEGPRLRRSSSTGVSTEKLEAATRAATMAATGSSSAGVTPTDMHLRSSSGRRASLSLLQLAVPEDFKGPSGTDASGSMLLEPPVLLADAILHLEQQLQQRPRGLPAPTQVPPRPPPLHVVLPPDSEASPATITTSPGTDEGDPSLPAIDDAWMAELVAGFSASNRKRPEARPSSTAVVVATSAVPADATSEQQLGGQAEHPVSAAAATAPLPAPKQVPSPAGASALDAKALHTPVVMAGSQSSSAPGTGGVDQRCDAVPTVSSSRPQGQVPLADTTGSTGARSSWAPQPASHGPAHTESHKLLLGRGSVADGNSSGAANVGQPYGASFCRYPSQDLLSAKELPCGLAGPAVWCLAPGPSALASAVGTLMRNAVERRSRGNAAAQGAAKLASGLVGTVWQVLDDCVVTPALQEYICQTSCMTQSFSADLCGRTDGL